MNNKIRAEFVIRGRVQGVGFRYFVQSKAKSIAGLTGFVKNQIDGSVLCICEGSKKNIGDLLKYLKIGPSRGYVEEIKEYYTDSNGEFKDFTTKF